MVQTTKPLNDDQVRDSVFLMMWEWRRAYGDCEGFVLRIGPEMEDQVRRALAALDGITIEVVDLT